MKKLYFGSYFPDWTVRFFEHLHLAVSSTSFRPNVFSRSLNESLVCALLFFAGSSTLLARPDLHSNQTLHLALGFVFVWVLVFSRFRFLLAPALGFYIVSLIFTAQLQAEFPTRWERQDISIEADIEGLPSYFDRDIRFFVKVTKQITDQELAPIVGKRFLLSCYRCNFKISAGQRWQFTVRVKRPHGYASEGAFDYEKYLFRHQVIAKGYVRTKDENYLISENNSPLQEFRARIKKRLYSILERDRGSATILALVLGDKSGFDSSDQKLLQRAGLNHLFAISGLHVGLVFGISLLLFKWVFNVLSLFYNRLFEVCARPKLVLLPSLSMACGYSALAGFAVSTQRALVMLLLFSLLRLLGREASLLRVLLFTACIVFVFDPFALLDTGFWLSFGAVFIICMASYGRTKISLLKLQPLLWIGMTPLTVLLFGHVSILSPLINLIAVPLFCVILIPLTLCFMGSTVLLDVEFTRYALSKLAAVYELIFEYLAVATEWQFAYLPMSGWSALSMLLFLCFWSAYLLRRQTLALLCLGFLSASIAFDIFKPASSDSTLKITLLDVGQGLSLVMQTVKGVSVYDTGPRYSSGFSTADAVLIPYLKSLGVKELVTLIVSHADNDHIGGFNSLVSQFGVAKTLTSRVDKIPAATPCAAGMRWNEGATEFEILSPDDDTPPGSNNRSCVLKISHYGVSVLLTGDIEKRVEQYLIRGGIDLSADILLVPHQGSKTSSTSHFLDAVQPSLALVAAGYLNHYGHPHSSVMQRYQYRRIPVLSTVESGSIEIKIDHQGYQTKAFRSEQTRFWHWRP